ncbi:hypothetical protein MKZ20_21665 [Psychrobacillus sp. FSL K6-2684]|uniref:hypothetical protein n=1 Tax=unclassified Psychrobacillus TaxID=2636677 RepID=UPI0030F611D6
MKKLLKSISIFLLVLLSFSSFQLKPASADSPESDSTLSVEYPIDLIEPLGEDDELPFCQGTFNSPDGESYVTIQTNTGSVNRSIQFGFFIKPSAYHKYRPGVDVFASAWVNNVKANSPYPGHYEVPEYNFHGSMKVYQVSGKNYNLKSGDIVRLYWSGSNPTSINGVKNVTLLNLECAVK